MPLPQRVALLAASHVVALAVLHVLLTAYEPNPNGFRFDTFGKALGIAASFAPPAVVALIAVRKPVVLALAAVHAASPLLLIGNMRDPNADLNLAVLLWWFPLPIAFGVVAIVDRLRSNRSGST
jgi:hypothetical protein